MNAQFQQLHSTEPIGSTGGVRLTGRMPSILAERVPRARSGTGLATAGESTAVDAGESGRASTKPDDRALVVLDGADPSSTLRAALQHIDLQNGRVRLLLVYPTAEYEARRRERIAAGLTTPYTIGQLEEEARLVALRTGHEWHRSSGGEFEATSGGEFEAIGAVGRLTDCVRRVVEDNECTLIYFAPTKRSMWQRILGGDEVGALARALPASTSVVQLDTTAEPGVIVAVAGTSASSQDTAELDATAADVEIPLGK